jgi:hypothetical protein
MGATGGLLLLRGRGGGLAEGVGDARIGAVIGESANCGNISRSCWAELGSRFVTDAHILHLIEPPPLALLAAHGRHKLWSQMRIRASSKSLKQSAHCIN